MPDVPPNEVAAALGACDEAGVALVPVVAPASDDDDLARVKTRARGFLYAVATPGKTGERAMLADGPQGPRRRRRPV